MHRTTCAVSTLQSRYHQAIAYLLHHPIQAKCNPHWSNPSPSRRSIPATKPMSIKRQDTARCSSATLTSTSGNSVATRSIPCLLPNTQTTLVCDIGTPHSFKVERAAMMVLAVAIMAVDSTRRKGQQRWNFTRVDDAYDPEHRAYLHLGWQATWSNTYIEESSIEVFKSP